MNAPKNPQAIQKGASDVTLLDASREYYIFDGWYADADKTDQIEKGILTQDTLARLADENDTVTLYADWRPEEYTITYILDGGSNAPDNPAVYNIESGDILLKSPTKEGAVFAGWYKDNSEKIEKITHGSTGNLVLHAKWIKDKPNDSGNSTPKKTNDTGNSPSKKISGKVKTGDTAHVLIWGFMLLAAGCGITISIRKKWKR